jgi:hypothetical protein
MRKLLIIILSILSYSAYSQTPLTISGIDTTVTGVNGYDVPRSTPTDLTFVKSKISSSQNVSYILKAGDDSYISAYDNNLDGAKILGNEIEWTGYATYPTSIMHGAMLGNNINYTTKHNFFDRAPYGAIYKGFDDEDFSWTAGIHAYNIHYNARLSAISKGMGGVKYYNNTFYSTRPNFLQHLIIADNSDGDQSQPYSQSDTTKVYNNIFYQKYNVPTIKVDTGAQNGLEIDYNIYWCEDCTNNTPNFMVADTTVTWNEWRSLGYDTHSQIKNPNLDANFIPSSRLEDGTNLGTSFSYGLSTDYSFSAGTYPDTTEQGTTWQVGAVIYPKESGSGGDYDYTDYPRLSEYNTLMGQFETDYPNLADASIIGQTVNGLNIRTLKISDNVTQDEDEPVVYINSTIHGSEAAAFIVSLKLIDYLLTNYSTNSQIKNIIDSTELWITPIVNIDGMYQDNNIYYQDSATRNNANDVDLNRNYSTPGQNPTPEPETSAIIDIMTSIKPNLAVDFHSGAEVVSYPWGYKATNHPDSVWYYNIGRRYADTVQAYEQFAYSYFDDSWNGVVNGYDWYPSNGVFTDYWNLNTNTKAVTIEFYRNWHLPQDEFDDVWNANYRSLLTFLETANDGIHGHVTEYATGNPIKAKIYISGHDSDSSFVYSDVSTGRYARYIQPGTWDLIFSATGYDNDTVQVTVDSYTDRVIQNVQLTQTQEIENASYYVATTGNDSNPGTIDSPFATMEKGMTSASPGDLVYIRGGVYNLTARIDNFTNGTSSNRITISNYPGETPIMDGGNLTGSLTAALYLNNASYITIKGIHFRNVWQSSPTATAIGARVAGGAGMIIENCKFYNIHGHGLEMRYSEDALVKNCDAYNCVDSLTNELPGNDGTGFFTFNWSDNTLKMYFEGNRAWYCGDQGFSIAGDGPMYGDNNWSFLNGQLEGEGHGFKIGWVNSPTTGVMNLELKNCIAAFNRETGITTNDQGYSSGWITVYNNTSFHNGYYAGYSDPASGILIYNTLSVDSLEDNRYFYNNISYDNEDYNLRTITGGGLNGTTVYTHSNNTWDGGGTADDTDFVSVDSATVVGMLLADRAADGSLPTKPLQLASGSDLIDAGTDMGDSYLGDAPDIGADEYDGATASTETDILTFTVNGVSGTINTTAHTVTAELPYGTSLTSLAPTFTISSGATAIPASGTSRDFTNARIYQITAEDESTVQDWTVTITAASAPTTNTERGTLDGKNITIDGKFIKL